MLLDHLINAAQQHTGYGDAECLGSDQVDDQIELGRLLNRDVDWGSAPQNLVDKIGGAPPQIREAWSKGYQPTGGHMLAVAAHSWQSRAVGQSDEVCPVGIYEWIVCYIKRFCATL
jgi:hypothetical protein